MKSTKRFFLAISLFISVISWAQEVNLDSLLEVKSKEVPALNEKVSISVSNSSVKEFMRGVANSSGLNIDVDPSMDFKIINNFSDVKVKDMLVFLAKQYNLNVQLIGNIITISQNKEVIIPNVTVIYNEQKETVSLDVSEEQLYTVAKIITDKTGKNVVPRGDARNEKIKCFIKEMPFEEAIKELALSNGLEMDKNENGFFVITKTKNPETETAQANTSPSRSSRSSRSSRGTTRTRNNTNSEGGGSNYILDVKKLRTDTLQVTLKEAPVEDILSELSNHINFNYFISPGTEEKITGSIKGKNIDRILTNLFKGTKITHKKAGNVYVVGEKKTIDFNEHRVITFEHRSIEKLLEFMPSDLKESLEIIEFPEQNSLFATGPAYQVNELESFAKSVDKVVPVVLIEIIIMYVNKTINESTGINAGLGESPVETTGTVFPGADLTIGANKINQILNGAGWVNLGNVSPNFYVTLQALESQGFLEVQSTPKLSTLNGHEATLSIGNTEYYLEERSQLYGTQNPQQTFTQEYKAVKAELSVKIKPIVSGDDQITLDIEVSQSDFTERISKTAPPGTVNRDFTSLIRVKNQEMILLGGLNENRESDSGSGTPILSRIPIIKWFFSSRQYEKGDSKLSVLIRPTVIN